MTEPGEGRAMPAVPPASDPWTSFRWPGGPAAPQRPLPPLGAATHPLASPRLPTAEASHPVGHAKADEHHERGRFGSAAVVAVRTVGELLMTFGVIILLFVAYELYFTGIATRHAQHALYVKFIAAPHVQPVGVPQFGSGIAVMLAPRLGRSWRWVVVQGVATADLAQGPGHYPGTAFPGGRGNFVVSGHRTTHGAPFYNVNEFQAGDAVIFETHTMWIVYRVTGETIVSPTDIAVILPVPGEPGAQPTAKLLTLTTCNPRYSAQQRLIVHGILAEEQPLSAGDPVALTTGRA